MIAAIVSEYRKFFSTRMWWILTLCMAGYFLLVAFGLAWMFAYIDELGDPGTQMFGQPQSMVYGLAPAMGYVFPVIIGAVAVTAEYRHRTLVPTFLGEPRRWVVMTAKAIAALPMGCAIGVAGTAVCLAGGALGFHIGGIETMLWTATTWYHAGLSVLACTLWALVGVGLGTLLTSQVGVIIAVLAFNQLVEPLLRLGLSLSSSTAPIAKFLPVAAAEATSGSPSIYSMSGMNGLADSLGIWQGALVLAGYGLVMGVLGYLTRTRRDLS